MKKTLIFLLGLISVMGYGQDYTITINFQPETIYHFSVTRGKYKSNEPTTKALTLLTDIEAVFSLNNDSLKCKWKYGESIPQGPEYLISQIGPEYREQMNLNQDIELELLIDPSLNEVELLNFRRVKEHIKQSIIKMYNSQITNIDSAAIAAMNPHLEATYSTPELLLGYYFPEIWLYFGIYGNKFSAGEKIEVEDFYLNPFGGEPIPIIGEMEINSIEEDVLKIKNSEKAPEEEVNKIIKNMIKKISQENNAHVKEEIPNFTLNFETFYFYNLATQIIARVKKEEIIVVNGISQTKLLEVNWIK